MEVLVEYRLQKFGEWAFSLSLRGVIIHYLNLRLLEAHRLVWTSKIGLHVELFFRRNIKLGHDGRRFWIWWQLCSAWWRLLLKGNNRQCSLASTESPTLFGLVDSHKHIFWCHISEMLLHRLAIEEGVAFWSHLRADCLGGRADCLHARQTNEDEPE